MNITEVKASISAQAGFQLSTLDLHEQKDDNDVVNPEWVSHWDNTHRVRVTMHRSIMDKIVADRGFDGLAIKNMETVTPKDTTKAAYRRFVVITPNILASL